MRRTFFLGLLALLSAIGVAQAPPSSPLTLAHEMALELASDAKADRLQMSPAQRSQVQAILNEFRQERDQFAGDLRYASEMPNRQRFYAQQVLRTLGDGQVVMLRRIGAQRLGPIALLRSDVTGVIGLNATQASQIQAIYTAYLRRVERVSANLARQMAEVPRPQNPKNPDQVKAYRQRQERVRERMRPVLEEVAEARSLVDESALARLRPEQRQRWQAFIDVR